MPITYLFKIKDLRFFYSKCVKYFDSRKQTCDVDHIINCIQVNDLAKVPGLIQERKETRRFYIKVEKVGSDTTFPWPAHFRRLNKSAIKGFNLFPEPIITQRIALLLIPGTVYLITSSA